MQNLYLLRIDNSKESTTYFLDANIITIGRALSNSISINDQGIDRHHVFLRYFSRENRQGYEIIFGQHPVYVCHQGEWSRPSSNAAVTLTTGDSFKIGASRLSYLETSMTLADSRLYFDVQPISNIRLQAEDLASICEAVGAA